MVLPPVAAVCVDEAGADVGFNAGTGPLVVAGLPLVVVDPTVAFVVVPVVDPLVVPVLLPVELAAVPVLLPVAVEPAAVPPAVVSGAVLLVVADWVVD